MISFALAIDAFHALRGGRENQFGAKQSQHLAAFDRHRFGHHQNQPIAARRRDEGERNAGVARRRLDQNTAPGRDQALRLERIDHRNADAVLDAGDRIEEFELGEKMGDDALFLADSVDADERRIADRIGDRRINPPAAWLSPRSACILHWPPLQNVRRTAPLSAIRR